MIRKILCFTSILLAGVGLNAEQYKVEAGDTLYGISLRYDISVEDLIRLNSIEDPSLLREGDLLFFFEPYEEYEVEPGDTLYEIALSHGMDFDEILELNEMAETDYIFPGQRIRVMATSEEAIAVDDVPGISEALMEPEETEEQVAIVIEKEDSPDVAVLASNQRRISPDEVPDWPVSGILTWIEGKIKGVKIECAPQSYIRAVEDGEVVWLGPYRGYGRVLLVSAGEDIYLYGGEFIEVVEVGDRVERNDILAGMDFLVEENGDSQVYFSIFRDGESINLVHYAP